MAVKTHVKKHLHNESYEITQNGKEFYKKLQGKFNLDFFDDLRLDNKENFHNDFFHNIKILKTLPTHNVLDENLKDILHKNLNIEYTASDVKLIIKNYHLLEIKDDIYFYKIIFNVECLRCKQFFTVIFDFKLNINEYSWKPDIIQDSCPNCELIFESDSYLSRWYMYDSSSENAL